MASINTQDPELFSETPVFAGTRVPIESLIGHLEAGVSLNNFFEDFPGVSKQHAQATLELYTSL